MFRPTSHYPQQSSPETRGQLLTVDRALRVLGEFSDTAIEWGVSDLARAIGLGKSQTQRILSTLAAAGFLQSRPVTHRYFLGPRLVTLGQLASQSSFVRPLLGGLAIECGESSVFCQPDGPNYRCTAAADGPGPFRYAMNVGQQFPGYCGGAAGDAIFAHLPAEHVRQLFAQQLERDDGEPGEAWNSLNRRYDHIRKVGTAVSFGDYDPRVVAIASPVMAQGAVIGSVTVLGQRDELVPKIEPITAAVRKAADKLNDLYRPKHSSPTDS